MANTTIGNVYIRIGANTDRLRGDLRAADRQIQAFGKKMKDVGSTLTQNVTLPLVGIGVGAIKAFGDLEALQKGLIAVMGSSSAASAEFEKLKEVAKLPGLGLEEAARGSVSLQSAGFSADQAREALLQFGNALATVGKGKNELNLVVLALTQLQNKSSGFGQDLRQLVEQLPQLRNALTSAFGTADSEAIAKLGVTGKQVVELLIGEFSKLPRVTGGINNAFENASDSIKIAFANLGESLNKNLNIEGLINRIADGVSNLAQSFSNLTPEAQATIITIAGIGAAVGPVIFIVGQLASSFSAIIALMKSAGVSATIAMGPIGWAIAAVVAAIGILIYKWEDIKAAFNETSGVLKVFIIPWQILKGIVITVVNILKTLIDVLGSVIGTVLRFVALVTGQMSWAEFKKTTVDSWTDTGEKAGKAFSNAAYKEVRKNLSGQFSGQDLLGQLTGGKSQQLDKPQALSPFVTGKFTGNEPKVEPAGGVKVEKETGYTLADFRKDINAVDILVKSGFMKSSEALEEKLKIITDAAKKFAEKGLKPTSKEMKAVIELQNKLKTFSTIEEMPKDITIGVTGGTEIEEALKKLNAEFVKIDKYKELKLIGNDEALKEKIKLIEDAVKSLLEKGLDPASKEITDLLGKKKSYEVEMEPQFSEMPADVAAKYGIGDPITVPVTPTIDEINLEKKLEKMKKAVADFLKTMADIGSVLNPALELGGQLLSNQMAVLDKKQQKERAAVQETITNEDEKAKRLAEIDAKYDKEKKKIQRKQAIAAKVSGIFNAIVSAFEGAAKALAIGPAGIPLAGVIKALGFANAAAIAAAPLPSLAIGTNMVKSDGLANIHKGEAIVPAKVVSGGYNGVPNLIQVVGKIAGTDIILGTKNSSELYNRMYA